MKTLKKLLYELKDEKEKGVHFVHSKENISYTSYSDLYKKSLWMRNYFFDKGIRPNNEVIISINNSEKFYITFWACILGNFIATPLKVSSDLYNLKNVLEVCNDATFVTDDPFLQEKVKKSDLKIKTCICLNDIASEKLDSILLNNDHIIDELDFIDNKDMDIAYIQFSSGSTNDIKGVGITNVGISLNNEGFRVYRHLTDKDIYVNWVPLYHNMGLFFNIFLPMENHCESHIIDTEYVIKNPLFYLYYCNKVRATFISSSNYYLRFVCELLQECTQKDEWDLSCIKTFLLGGEPISTNLCNQFTNLLRKRKLNPAALCPAYGLTEGTLAVSVTTCSKCFENITVSKQNLCIGDTLDIVSSDNPVASEIISVGKPLSNFELKIVDLDGNTLNDGCIGLLLISGKSVLNNYYNRQRDENFIDKWFNTGDIGFMYRDNLYITARYKGMFIYNSLNYYDNDIEKYIERLNILDNERTVIHGYRKNTDDINDEIICFIEGNNSIETLASKIKNILHHINNDLGIYINNFVQVDHIPTTISGKVQRYKLLKNFLNGDYDYQINILTEELKNANNIIEHNISSIEDFIVDTLEDIVDHQIDYSTSFISMGLNSLQLSKLHMAINIQYGDCIAIAEFFEYTNIDSLAEYIMEKIDQKKETETLIS